ncbi:unnamed protein product [Heterobilharzia americana]|nr:unnamed protein product [Heterobilharzia americana]
MLLYKPLDVSLLRFTVVGPLVYICNRQGCTIHFFFQNDISKSMKNEDSKQLEGYSAAVLIRLLSFLGNL